MKRYNHIIEEIISKENLYDSFDEVVRGTKRKMSSEGKYLIANKDSFLSLVRHEIETSNISLMPLHRNPSQEEIKNGGCYTVEIKEGGKVRVIQVFTMSARIKVNAVMRVVDRYLARRFIRTTAASIKNRGIQDLKSYIEQDLSYGEIKYWYKFDIRKFYDTVDQKYAIAALRKIFKDKRLLTILEKFIRLFDGGIGVSMGLRSSQGICNLLLSTYLDHYLKDTCRVKYYYRYCDDGVIGHSSKEYLWRCRDIVHERINAINQEVKPNERIFPVSEGLDFLGYVIYPTHTLLRKRVKKAFLRKLNKVKSRKRRRELVGSYWGMAKHCNSVNLINKTLNKQEIDRLMKKFSELNITYTPSDGKKRFQGRQIQLRQLVNVEIEVLDFEVDVKTKYGLRCLVSFMNTKTGETCKFFTDSEEMKANLDTARKLREIPFSTVISVEYFDNNKAKYKFT